MKLFAILHLCGVTHLTTCLNPHPVLNAKILWHPYIKNRRDICSGVRVASTCIAGCSIKSIHEIASSSMINHSHSCGCPAGRDGPKLRRWLLALDIG